MISAALWQKVEVNEATPSSPIEIPQKSYLSIIQTDLQEKKIVLQ